MTPPKRISHLGVYGIIRSGECILLIKKSRGVYNGLLDLPGGTPEFFEQFEETLKREILEETGLITGMCSLLFPLLVIKNFDNTTIRHIGIIYLINDFYGELKNGSDGQDSRGCIFLNLNKVNEELCTPLVCDAIENLKRLYI